MVTVIDCKGLSGSVPRNGTTMLSVSSGAVIGEPTVAVGVSFTPPIVIVSVVVAEPPLPSLTE